MAQVRDTIAIDNKPETSLHEDDTKGDEPILETRFASLTRWQALKTFKRVFMFCGFAAFASLNDGYQYNLTGGIIANPTFIEQFATGTNSAGEPVIADSVISLWSGLLAATNFVGVIAAGWASEYIGQRGTMWAFTVLIILGTILELVATEWKVWLAAKTIFGLGLGFTQTIVNTYNSELGPPQIRGACIALYQLGFALGQLTSSIALQVVVTSYPGSRGYMNALYSEWVLHGIWLCMLVTLPESPWYLARRGKHEKAKKALKWLVGSVEGYDIDHEYAVALQAIKRREELEQSQSTASWAELFRGPDLRRTMASALGMANQQLVGGVVFFTFFTYLFQQSGLQDPFLATLIIFVILNVFIYVSFFVIEFVGRRFAMILGTSLLAFVNIGLGIVGSVELNAAAQRAALVVTCFFMAIYALSCAPIGYLSAVEISTPRLRQKTSAVAFGSWQGLNLILSFTIPLFISRHQLKTSYLFAGTAALSAIAQYFIYPETKGRTNTELDELFESGISARHFAQYKTKVDLAGLKHREAVA